MGIRHGVGAGVALGLPLVRTAGALGELPLKLVEVLEVLVGPLRRFGGPSDFEAAGDGVAGDAGLVGAAPAEALVLDGGAFGLLVEMAAGAGTVGLAEGVATGDERDGFCVVHGHAAEGDADVLGGSGGVGHSFGAFRVDIDEAHGGGGEALFEFAIAGVALVGAHPGGFRAEVDVVIRLPGVGAAAGEAEGFEAHGFEGNVAGEDEQVGPGDFLAVLLLDGPEEATGAIKVGVIRPAVERRKALLAASSATPAVVGAVGAGSVPGETDEEGAVVAEVSGPPVL